MWQGVIVSVFVREIRSRMLIIFAENMKRSCLTRSSKCFTTDDTRSGQND
ncbi:unnamed protein product [Tenebrio molitor]|nr:unnamed protein product [Tenebrio molitor]